MPHVGWTWNVQISFWRNTLMPVMPSGRAMPSTTRITSSGYSVVGRGVLGSKSSHCPDAPST